MKRNKGYGTIFFFAKSLIFKCLPEAADSGSAL